MIAELAIRWGCRKLICPVSAASVYVCLGFVDKRDSQRRQDMIQDSFRVEICFDTEADTGRGVGVFRTFLGSRAPAQRA